MAFECPQQTKVDNFSINDIIDNYWCFKIPGVISVSYSRKVPVSKSLVTFISITKYNNGEKTYIEKTNPHSHIIFRKFLKLARKYNIEKIEMINNNFLQISMHDERILTIMNDVDAQMVDVQEYDFIQSF